MVATTLHNLKEPFHHVHLHTHSFPGIRALYLIGAPRKVSLRGTYHWCRFHFYRVVMVLEVAMHMRRAKKNKKRRQPITAHH